MRIHGAELGPERVDQLVDLGTGEFSNTGAERHPRLHDAAEDSVRLDRFVLLVGVVDVQRLEVPFGDQVIARFRRVRDIVLKAIKRVIKKNWLTSSGSSSGEELLLVARFARRLTRFSTSGSGSSYSSSSLNRLRFRSMDFLIFNLVMEG